MAIVEIDLTEMPREDDDAFDIGIVDGAGVSDIVVRFEDVRVQMTMDQFGFLYDAMKKFWEEPPATEEPPTRAVAGKIGKNTGAKGRS